jgi:hypothetical protein
MKQVRWYFRTNVVLRDALVWRPSRCRIVMCLAEPRRQSALAMRPSLYQSGDKTSGEFFTNRIPLFTHPVTEMCDDVMFYWLKTLRSSRLRFGRVSVFLFFFFQLFKEPQQVLYIVLQYHTKCLLLSISLVNQFYRLHFLR